MPDSYEAEDAAARSRRARQFRVLRAEIGATQLSIAEYLQKSVSTIGRWERNKSPIPDDAMEALERVRGTRRDGPDLTQSFPQVAVQSEIDSGGRRCHVERLDPTLTGGELGRIEALLGEILNHLDGYQVDAETFADIAAQIETIQAQTRSPHPSRFVVSFTLQLLGAIVTSLIGAGIWEAHGRDIMRLLDEIR